MTSPANHAPSGALRVASLSDVGRVRTVNEDSCDSVERGDGAWLLVVADGMGGHRGGATASREAVATIAASFSESTSADAFETLHRAIERANEHVFSMAREDPGLAGMGTTVVALLLDAAGRGAVAHVGDSRCYRWRGRSLAPLTTDHSVVAEMQRRGVLTAEEAAYHPRRNEILRSVGVLSEVEVELAAVEIAAGDWYLLCSDGLCGVASEAEIEEVLASETSPDAAARALVALANECGGPDNVTVQILGIPDAWPALADDSRPAHASTRSIGGSGDDGRGAGAAGGEAGGGASRDSRAGSAPGLRARASALADSPSAAWIVIALFSVVAYGLWRLWLK